MNLLSHYNKKMCFTLLFSSLLCIGLSFVSMKMFIEAVDSRMVFPNRFTSWLITPSPWLMEWLNNPACDVPCWENVVPGTTSRDQAKVLLSNNPEIASVEEGNVIPYGMMLFVDIGSDKQNPNVSIKFDDQNIAQEIDLITFSNRLYLGNVVSVYGFPKQVLVRDQPNNEYVLVDLLYPELGIVLELFMHNLGGETPLVQIDKYVEIRDLYLEMPGLKYYFTTSAIIDGSVDPRLLSEWKGYTTYP